MFLHVFKRTRLKRPIMIMVLSMLVLFQTVAVNAADAGAGDLSHFRKSLSYSDGLFSDVAGGSWYAENVRTVYEYGIMNGLAANRFDPENNVTVAQALVMAARVRAVYEDLPVDFKSSPGEKWYMPYVRFAVMKGIIRVNDFYGLYDKPATRAQLAHIYANALPGSEYAQINSILSLPDVSDKNVYWTEILKLYNAGILAGADEYGTFHPLDKISRAESAAIISRLFLPSLRRNVALESYSGSVYSGVRDCVYRWTYPEPDSEWTLTLSMPEELYGQCAATDRSGLGYVDYVDQSADNEYLAALADKLRDAAKEKNYSDWQLVHLAAGFVQSLTCDYGAGAENDGYVKFPIETLFDMGGDSEDKSVLLAAILRELRFGAVLVRVDGHFGVGIKGDADIAGTFWTYDGSQYFFIETMLKGSAVGELPARYAGKTAEVIPL